MSKINISTKQRIVYEAMKLFSTYGFDAVSIRDIAAAVNVGNSALYKHFKNKQEILDNIIEYSQEHYKYMTENMTKKISDLESVFNYCIELFQFQMIDKWMIMFRKLLLIEQFKNPELSKMYKEFFIDIPINIQKEVFDKLIEAGVMKNKNSYVMAMELYAPFFLGYTLELDDSMEKNLEVHIKNFCKENLKQQ